MKRIPVLLAVLLLLTGCGADSLLPWLDETSIVPCNRELVGEWVVSERGAKRDRRLVVSIKEKKTVLGGKRTLPEKYRITIYDTDGKRAASLTAHPHSVNGVQLLQVQRFGGRPSDEISSVITYGLWRIESDCNNVMLWIPEFYMDILKAPDKAPVKMVQAGHEHEQPIFVDTTKNLQTFIEKWTKTYEESETKLPVALHRKGKEFSMPAGVKKRR